MGSRLPTTLLNASKIRVNGLKPGSRLRPVPGQTRIPLTLEAVATQGPHYWLLDGKLVAHNQNQHKKTTRLVIDSAGQHSIALIDSAGNHTSVDFWVDL